MVTSVKEKNKRMDIRTMGLVVRMRDENFIDFI